jgi:hypothetical protein
MGNTTAALPSHVWSYSMADTWQHSASDNLLLIIGASVLVLFVGSFSFLGKKRNPNGLPLPPGPKGLPLVGNVLDLPKEYECLTYTDWRATYGACDL